MKSCAFVTEEEARLLWCPFARVSLPGNAAGNRISSFHMKLAANEAARTGNSRDIDHYQQQNRDCACIASRCMAWRTQTVQDPLTKADIKRGYCGLVGEP